MQAPGEPLPGDVILRGDADWVGPGHVDVATDDAGGDWMLYHAAPRGSAVLPNGVQRRCLMLDRLDWVGGWPVVGDGTPSEARPAPVATRPRSTGSCTVRHRRTTPPSCASPTPSARSSAR